MKSVQREITDRVERLFRRHPALVGFAVLADGGSAEIDVAVAPWAGEDRRHALKVEVVAEVVDLAARHPQAMDLLSGHSFARVLH